MKLIILHRCHIKWIFFRCKTSKLIITTTWLLIWSFRIFSSRIIASLSWSIFASIRLWILLIWIWCSIGWIPCWLLLIYFLCHWHCSSFFRRYTCTCFSCVLPLHLRMLSSIRVSWFLILRICMVRLPLLSFAWIILILFLCILIIVLLI